MLTKLRMLLDVRPRWHFGLVCWLLCCSVGLVAAEPLAGKPFESALDQKIGRVWSGQDAHTLRGVLQELAISKNVSILLDRRIDPGQSVELTLPPTPLRELVGALSKKTESGVSIVGNVVYVGPTESARKLRTLVELRNNDLSKLAAATKSAKSPWRNRPTALTVRKSFTWQELDRPRDIVQQVASRFQIEVMGLEELPHDLWAAGSLPQVTAIETLSLLLVQFGSTFEFADDQVAVRVVPIPDRVFVEKSHTVLANSPVILEAARKQFVDVELEQSGSKLIARGTVERQAEIAAWLRPNNSKTSKTPDRPGEKPLAERLFTFSQKNVPLGDLIKTFVAFGIKIDYDREQFAAEKIPLDRKVDIDEKSVTIETLFRKHFEPVGVEVRVVGDELHLRLKTD